MALRLYTYWRSSAAYRVRIALALKGLPYESVPKHLLRDGGEQKQPDYLAVNPQGLVPALADGGFVVPQSLAIACDIHPLNNLAITQYLRTDLQADDAGVNRWVAHWITRGFVALERWVASVADGGHAADQRHCHGSQVTLADVCLVPQMYNARRFGVDVSAYPRLVAACTHLETLPAFVAARPENQPDAERK